MRSKIVKILWENRGQYISGESLSEVLGISRAAVWKHIKALKEDGAVIDSVSNRGYQLKKMPDLLKGEYIKPFFTEEQEELSWIWMDEVDSTNNYAKQHAAALKDKSIVLCEQQTGGKGRLGRAWITQKGENISLSILVKPDIQPKNAPAITLMTGLAVILGIQKATGIPAQVKWPNDVVLGKKKLCGILVEMTADMDKIDHLVAGIGINVNRAAFDGELKEKATSLQIEAGKPLSRCQIAAAVIQSFFHLYEEFLQNGIKNLLEKYTSRSAIVNSQIEILGLNHEAKGICRGFTQDGALILEGEQGRELISAGEVSVRGENTYR